MGGSAMWVIVGILGSSLKEYNRLATNLTNVQQVGRAREQRET